MRNTWIFTEYDIVLVGHMNWPLLISSGNVRLINNMDGTRILHLS